MRSIAAIAVALLIVPAVQAQQQEELARKKMMEAAAGRGSLEPKVNLESSIKGAPYSADVITETTQTLADGNHIMNRTAGHVYRDGEGRTRREEEKQLTARTPNGPVTVHTTAISIVDPVGGYSYSLNPEQKIAWRTPIGISNELLDKIKASVASGARSGGRPAEMTPEQKAAAGEQMERMKAEYERLAADVAQAKEAKANAAARGGGEPANVTMRGRAYAMAPDTPLEHKTIEGIAVEGRKTTEVIPAGEIGNEQPITITSEEWRSPELHVLVLTRHTDPRTGESTYRLTNIVRAEPDRSYFMVPPDYTVKDTGIKRNNE